MPIKVNRDDLNDLLADLLSRHGWDDDGSIGEADRLDDLTYTVGDALDAFLNTPEPQTEADPDRMEDME